MSRRKGEFEHRTSIFEGAYRAWSHLGGLDPSTLFAADAAKTLHPLAVPIGENDDWRITNDEEEKKLMEKVKMKSSHIRGMATYFPYEPLPRIGLTHTFVQGIIAPWLGPQADSENVKMGLATLRTWWQHRRRGESHSAIQVLTTEKMQSVVQGYSIHFFELALKVVVHGKEQPPKSLMGKLPKSEHNNNNNNDKVKEKRSMSISTGSGDSQKKDDNEMDEQQKQSALTTMDPSDKLKKKRRLNRKEIDVDEDAKYSYISSTNHSSSVLVDSNRIPIVFASRNGDFHIAMNINGITCLSCVKMIETILRGDIGSSVDGILDVVGHFELSAILIKISDASKAKTIAMQASELLSMIGYQAVAKEIDLTGRRGKALDSTALNAAHVYAMSNDPTILFDWTQDCTCPDHGSVGIDCMR